MADHYTTRIRTIIDSPGDKLVQLAELVVECAGPGRERALAERELATMAARRPALAHLARHWRENVAELAATLTDDPTAVATLVATSDGLCTAVLIDAIPADTDHVHQVLAHALGGHPEKPAAPN